MGLYWCVEKSHDEVDHLRRSSLVHRGVDRLEAFEAREAKRDEPARLLHRSEHPRQPRPHHHGSLHPGPGLSGLSGVAWDGCTGGVDHLQGDVGDLTLTLTPTPTPTLTLIGVDHL